MASNITMATNKNYLMIEELNSDRGEPQMLQNFQMGSTVKDLKLAIANLLGDGTDWHAIMTIFVGEEMEDSESKTVRRDSHWRPVR